MSTHARVHTPHTFSLSLVQGHVSSEWDTLPVLLAARISPFPPRSISVRPGPPHMARLQRAPFMFCGLPGDRLHWSRNVSYCVAPAELLASETKMWPDWRVWGGS